MRRVLPLALLGFTLVATACLPAAPSAGRPGHIGKVEVVGDSLTWGLFSATPWIRTEMEKRMYVRRMSFTMDGGPAENAMQTFLDPTPWVDRLAARIAADNPDVIIIQSSLFDAPDTPGRQDAYRAAFAALIDMAKSRDAHVYLVTNHVPPDAKLAAELDVAERIQRDVVAGRGISMIPVDLWLDTCKGAFIPDGIHLTQAGVECEANGLTAAIDQLRKQAG